MEVRKSKLSMYLILSLLIFTFCLNNVNASEYINYFGISMTSQQYNNLLNLGFSENEIYYMDEDTFEANKDISAELVARDARYYKSIYTDLNGNEQTVEISKEEYDNQGTLNARGTVSTTYKEMVTTMSRNGDKFRYKVTVGWKQMPSVRSYDIIGIGFEDDVYISSSVYFNYTYCVLSGDCTTDTLYYNKKKLSTGGSAVYKFPSSARSMTAVLYYDVSKNTNDTITDLYMYGDYAHATESVGSSTYTDYTINYNGIVLGGPSISSYDAMPCAVTSWGGTW